jgi:hypothetical protein
MALHARAKGEETYYHVPIEAKKKVVMRYALYVGDRKATLAAPCAQQRFQEPPYLWRHGRHDSDGPDQA